MERKNRTRKFSNAGRRRGILNGKKRNTFEFESKNHFVNVREVIMNVN